MGGLSQLQRFFPRRKESEPHMELPSLQWKAEPPECLVLNNKFEDIIAENFLNLGKKTDIKVQEVQRVPNKINPKRNTPTHCN